MKRLTLPLLALAALSACDNTAPEEAETPAATETSAASDAQPVESATPTPAPSPTSIPAAIQGRWGMNAADCEPGRSDNKGLLTISENKLEFYESVGTLDEIQEASDTRIRASFDFIGEGMTWERDITLDVQDGGETLVRREDGVDAAPGAFRYSKCD